MWHGFILSGTCSLSTFILLKNFECILNSTKIYFNLRCPTSSDSVKDSWPSYQNILSYQNIFTSEEFPKPIRSNSINCVRIESVSEDGLNAENYFRDGLILKLCRNSDGDASKTNVLRITSLEGAAIKV